MPWEGMAFGAASEETANLDGRRAGVMQRPHRRWARRCARHVQAACTLGSIEQTSYASSKRHRGTRRGHVQRALAKGTHVSSQVGVAGVLWDGLAFRQVRHQRALVIHAQLLRHRPAGEWRWEETNRVKSGASREHL